MVYDNFFSYSGIAVAKNWIFYHWSAEKGIYGPPQGKVTLKKLRFFNPRPNFFTIPEKAVSLD